MQRQLFYDDDEVEPVGNRSFSERVRDENFQGMAEDLVVDRERVYDAVLSHPNGICCKELASKWGCNPNDISGRFTELRKSGRILAIGKKLLPNHKGQMRSNTLWGGL